MEAIGYDNVQSISVEMQKNDASILKMQEVFFL